MLHKTVSPVMLNFTHCESVVKIIEIQTTRAIVLR